MMNDNLEKIRSILKEKNIELSKITCCFTGHRPQSLPWGFNEQDERTIKNGNYKGNWKRIYDIYFRYGSRF